MLFVPRGSSTPQAGRLLDDPSRPGTLVLLDSGNLAFPPDQVSWVIADDEPMAEAARKAGYAVHTPMSLHLGTGATDPLIRR